MNPESHLNYNSRKITGAFKASIRMLSLSKAELLDLVRRKVEENPYLEMIPLRRLEATASVESDLRVVSRNGRWKVILKTDDFPRLRVRLTPLERQHAASRASAREAQWFIESLRGYYRLLLSLCQAITTEQEAFLDGKTDWPRRLTLVQLAEVVGLHPSTLSRLLRNKKVETPRGIFSLGFLVSPFREPERIQRAIAEILAETDGTPITDLEIAFQLQSQGLAISRRTVCKLRNGLKGA